MKIVITVISTVVFFIVVGLIIMYSGLYNVSVLDGSSAFTEWVLSTTMEHSVEQRADDIKVPDLYDEQMIREGAGHYARMCVGCHSAPGKEVTEMAKGLEPKPPLLYKTEGPDEAEAFWIIKNGIKMTSMPAWGVTHSDDKIWDIVAFLQKLPNLSPAEYDRMVSAVSGPEEGHEHAEGEEEGHIHD